MCSHCRNKGAAHGNLRSMPYRIICGCTLLIAVVVSVIYPAIYTSLLAAPKYAALVKSIEDVAANSNIKMYMISGSPTTSYVLV